MAPVTSSKDAKARVEKLFNERKDLEAHVNRLSAKLQLLGVGLKGQLVDADGYPRNDISIIEIIQLRGEINIGLNDLKALYMKIESTLKTFHELYRLENSIETTTAYSHDPDLGELRNKWHNNDAQINAQQKSDSVHMPSNTQSGLSSGLSSSPASVDSESAGPDAPVTRDAAFDPFLSALMGSLSMLDSFAKFDNVAESSPANCAGIKDHDYVISVGPIKRAGKGGLCKEPCSASEQRSLIQDVGRFTATQENHPVELIIFRNTEEFNGIRKITVIPKKWQGEGLLGCRLLPID